MKRLLLAMALLALPTYVGAQEAVPAAEPVLVAALEPVNIPTMPEGLVLPSSVATTLIVASAPVKDAKPAPGFDKQMLAASAFLAATETYDMVTSWQLDVRCLHYCKEGDVFARPVMALPHPLALTATLAFGVGVDILSAKMRRSHNSVIRHLWPVPQLLLGTGHIHYGNMNRKFPGIWIVLNPSGGGH